MGEQDVSERHDSEPTAEGVGDPDPARADVVEGGLTGAGYPETAARLLDLDAIEERAAAPATHLDVETALGIDLPALVGAIRVALALHPKIRVYTSGSTDPKHVPDCRVLCGLCRDLWPCKTVQALGGGN